MLISTQTDVEYVVLKSMRVKPTSVHLNYDRKKEELGFFPYKKVGLDRFLFLKLNRPCCCDNMT